MPVPRRDARPASRSTTSWAATTASAAGPRATSSASSRTSSTSTSSGAVEWLANRTGITLQLHDGRRGPRPPAPQAPGRGDGAGRRVVPPAPAHRARRPRRPATTCAAAASTATWPASSGSGWAPDDWDALVRERRHWPADVLRDAGLAFSNRRDRMQDAFRARVMFPIFNEVGDPVAFGGRVLPGQHGPGQVQELARDADLHQVQDPLRAQLGQGRHRADRPGRRVRGLHRRDRLPPRRRRPGRRHLRHGPHRGARPAAEALRQPRGAGLRRRRRRPRRGRAVLRVGAGLRAVGERGRACRPASTPASWPAGTPTALVRCRRRGSALPRPSASIACWPAPADHQRGAGRRGRGGHGGGQRASRASSCATSTPPRWPCAAASPPDDLVRLAEPAAPPAARRGRQPRRRAAGGHRRDDRARRSPSTTGPACGRGCTRCCSTTPPTAPPSGPSTRPTASWPRRSTQAEPAAAELLQRLVVEEPADDPAQEVFHLIRTAALREVRGCCRRPATPPPIRDVRLLEQRLDDPEAGPDAAAQLLGWLETRVGERV